MLTETRKRAPHDSTQIELVTIYEISKILSSSFDLQKTLYNVLNVLTNHLRMERSMVSLVHEDGDLHITAGVGMSAEEMKKGQFGEGEGVTGRILKSGMPAVIPDIHKEPLFLSRTGVRNVVSGANQLSFIGVPIRVGREGIGVLAIERKTNRGTHKFEEDVRFLTMVANLIGQTVILHQRVVDDRNELMKEHSRLHREPKGKYSLDNIIGHSKIMQSVFAEVHKAAPGRSTVLLRGESGTGKEAISRAIHFLSPRANAPFIKVNCAALSETILESELFGHEKGAFTGASSERKGRFEQANGGTLFLDEIGDTSAAFQVKLLRVLQEREFERVGGNKTIKVDVRLITATNRNLEEMVIKGQFRDDLYYRINVVSIFIPPLRERKEDIPLLVDHFLARFNKDSGRKITFSPEAMQVLLQCAWPGNVRELENCIERSATMSGVDVIRDFEIPCQRNKCFSSSLWTAGATRRPIPVVAVSGDDATNTIPTDMVETSADESPDGKKPKNQRQHLIEALEKCGWVQAKAARMLNLTPRQLGYALKKYGIMVKQL